MSDENLSYFERLQKIKLGQLPKEAVAKKKKQLNKVSPKRAKQIAEEKELRGDNDTEKQKWFRNRIKQMTGYCAETGLRTETKIYQYAIMSVCHILPQRLCPSVALHPDNWIELAPDIHHKFDNISWEEREKWGCWELIVYKLIKVYPSLAPEEMRYFPESVLKIIQKQK